MTGRGRSLLLVFLLAGLGVAGLASASPAGAITEFSDGVATVAPVVMVRPRVVGAARVGRVLSCMPPRVRGASSLTFGWRRTGRTIRGARQLRYEVQGADRGKLLTCAVHAQGRGGAIITLSPPVRVARTATISLRFGYVTTPQHPYGVSVAAFKAAVEVASGGSIKITPVPQAAGGNDVTLLGDVAGGSIGMALVSTTVWDSAGVRVFQPLQAPFLITNYALDESVLGGPIGRAMLASRNGPAKLGLVGLGMVEGGLRKPVGRAVALKSPADFNGKVLRAPPTQVMSSALSALGAQPVAMPLGDVSAALKQGVIDGVEANYGLIATQKFYEGAQFVTSDVNLWPFPAAMVISKARWDNLAASQRTILRNAGANLAKTEIEGVFINPRPGATDFVKVLCDAGLTFAIAGEANKQALAAAVQPVLDTLAADPNTGGFLKQIQAAKAAAAPDPPLAPLPAGCKTA
jgi:TRAP-type C4-dicarboxylate transport system substrate-binding protein